MSIAVASRYAEALLDVIEEPSSGVEAQQAVDQLRAFAELLRKSAELRTVLLNPAVPPARKRTVVSRLAEPLSVTPIIRNFLLVVIDRRRIGLLDDIRDRFEELLDERREVIRAEVTSAGELSKAQREKVRGQLSESLGKQVRCDFSADEDLIGGALVRIGSTVYDGSVRGQLAILRQRLME